MPPTEEVSDNELETLDELGRDFENTKSNNFDTQTLSDKSFNKKNLEFDQCMPLNTYRQTEAPQQDQSSKILPEDKNNLDSDIYAQNELNAAYSRPSEKGFSGNKDFSPHSPVSSPELNDLEDIGSNSPTTFSSQCDRVPPYLLSDFDTNRSNPNQSHNQQYNFDKLQQFPNYLDREPNRNQSLGLKVQSPHYVEKERYINYSTLEAVNQSPDRSVRSGSYKSYNQQAHNPYYNHSGSDSDIDNRYRLSPQRDNPSQFDTNIMARDRHSNNHRSNAYDSRDQSSRNYLRDSENDHYEANSKHNRRERSMSSDRNSYPDKHDSLPKKKDKKAKKSKKSKKEKKYKDSRSGNKKGRSDEYDNMDGSPVSSDPDIDGRNSSSSYRHGSRNRNRTGKVAFLLIFFKKS